MRRVSFDAGLCLTGWLLKNSYDSSRSSCLPQRLAVGNRLFSVSATHWYQRGFCQAKTRRRKGAPFLFFLAAGEQSTKHQIPSSREVPNLKHRTPKQDGGQTARRSVLSLELGASLELGVWDLELVARVLSFSK